MSTNEAITTCDYNPIHEISEKRFMSSYIFYIPWIINCDLVILLKRFKDYYSKAIQMSERIDASDCKLFLQSTLNPP